MQKEREQQHQGNASHIHDEVDQVMSTRGSFHDPFPSNLLGKSFDLHRQSSQLGATTSCLSTKPSVDPIIHEEHDRMWRAMISDDDDDITDYIVSITASAEHYEHNHPTIWLRNFVTDLVEGHPRWCCGTYVYMNVD